MASATFTEAMGKRIIALGTNKYYFGKMKIIEWMNEHYLDVEYDLGSSVLQVTEFELDEQYPSALSSFEDPDVSV